MVINMRHYIEAAGEIMIKKMRRNNSIIVLYLLSAIILAGCAQNTFVELLSRNDNDISRDGMAYVQSIILTVASPSENHVHHINYPQNYYIFTTTNQMVELNLDIDSAHWISEEDLDFFLEYIDEHRNDERTEDSVFAYSLSVAYYDENSELQYNYLYCYDAFPEDLNEVIDKLNSLCRENIMEYPEELVTDYPSFIYRELGVSEEEYPREDIEAMIEMDTTSTIMLFSTQSFQSSMNSYYHSLAWDRIAGYIPTDLREPTYINDASYINFVNAYLEELGPEWHIYTDINPNGITFIDGPDGHYMRIARADIVSQWQDEGRMEGFDSRGGAYRMEEGGCGLDRMCSFIYDEGARFILIDYDFSGTNFDENVITFYYLHSRLYE